MNEVTEVNIPVPDIFVSSPETPQIRSSTGKMCSMFSLGEVSSWQSFMDAENFSSEENQINVHSNMSSNTVSEEEMIHEMAQEIQPKKRDVALRSKVKTKNQKRTEYDTILKERSKGEQYERSIRCSNNKTQAQQSTSGNKKLKSIEEFLSLPILAGIQELIVKEERGNLHVSNQSSKDMNSLNTLLKPVGSNVSLKQKNQEQINDKNDILEHRKQIVQEMYDKAITRKEVAQQSLEKGSPPHFQNTYNVSSFLPPWILNVGQLQPEINRKYPNELDNSLVERDSASEYEVSPLSTAKRQKLPTCTHYRLQGKRRSRTAGKREQEDVKQDGKQVKSEAFSNRSHTAQLKRWTRRRERVDHSPNQDMESLEREKIATPLKIFRGAHGWDGSVRVQKYLSQVNGNITLQKRAFCKQIVTSSALELDSNQRYRPQTSSLKPYNNYIANLPSI